MDYFDDVIEISAGFMGDEVTREVEVDRDIYVSDMDVEDFLSEISDEMTNDYVSVSWERV